MALPSNVMSSTSSSSPYLNDCNTPYSMSDPNTLYTHPFPPSMYHYGPPPSTSSQQQPPPVQYGYNNNPINGNHPYSYIKPESMSQQHFYPPPPPPPLPHQDYSPPDQSSPEQHM